MTEKKSREFSLRRFDPTDEWNYLTVMGETSGNFLEEAGISPKEILPPSYTKGNSHSLIE